MILNDIIHIIESVAPLGRQEEWDNSGLQIGNGNADIKSVLLTTDVSLSVVEEAIEQHCQLILSHHPLLYRGLKSICGNTDQENCAITAIKNDIAIYSAHTSMDNYIYGVSGKMAEKIGIQSYRVLVPQDNDQYGLGVIGELPVAMPFNQLLAHVGKVFSTDTLRYIKPLKDEVKTIALCGGAGSEFMKDAIQQKADLFITADFKYHSLQEAVGKIGVIDMDHWVSEHFTREVFARLLKDKVETLVSSKDRSPIGYWHKEMGA